MSILAIILNIIIGLASGVFGGLGMGGGTLLIPLLTICLGFPQKLAQGINLLSFLVMAVFSLIIHYKNGFLHLKGVFLIIVFGLASSVVGSLLASIVDGEILRKLFGVFLCILALFQMIKIVKT